MTKKIFTFALLATTLVANAQIGFEKIDGITSEIRFAKSENFVDGTALYTVEVINNKDSKFTIFNSDLSVNRTFTIHDSANAYGTTLLPYSAAGYYDRTSLLTQDLFNWDDKFEVLRVSTGNDGVAKVEIVAEDETILGELPLALVITRGDDGDLSQAWISGFYTKEGDYKYLIKRTSINYSYTYEYYRITNTPAGVPSFQKVENKSIAFPNPVDHNDVLTINVSDLNLSDGSYVEISNLNGQIVNRQTVEPGKTETSISTRRLHSGQYIYSVVSDGNVVESGKIIIK